MGGLRLITGIALLPMCYAATVTFLTLLSSPELASDTMLVSQSGWLLLGVLVWLGCWIFLTKPMRLYVAGHELTHALWALLFGARVSKLRISAAGGSVQVSKTNLWITLAPYFFPFYTMVIILARWLVGLWLQPQPWPELWLFLVGLSWGLHLCFTLQSLSLHQPDIQEYGRLFSYVVIYLMNLLGLSLWLVGSSAIGARAAIRLLAAQTLVSYTTIGTGVRLLWQALATLRNAV